MTESQQEKPANETGPEVAAAPAPEAPAPEAPAPAFDAGQARAEIAELKDRLLRALAETENLRRRFEREREETAKFAVSRFARDLLAVADNLRRALESAPQGGELPEALKNVIAGVEVTERELLAVFERHEIRRIDPLGEKFDANLHQAMFEVESADQPRGTVVQVVAPGYTIAGRLLRAAMVGVSKGAPAAPAPAPAANAGAAKPQHIDTKA